jgi:hypothetical protein
MPVKRQSTGFFESNCESILSGPLSFRLDSPGGPTAMLKQSRLSALKAAKTAKLHMATNGGLGFTAEFPFGRESSLFRGTGRDPHPRYGNGLPLTQSFRTTDLSEQEGVRLALSLNTGELAKHPAGYGFGSYCYHDSCIHFTSFLPNAAYMQELIPNFYYAAANRAWHMSKLLKDADWEDM